MISIVELRAELDERIDDAAREAAESHKMAMNSYGASCVVVYVAGYDAGFVAALREVSALLTEGQHEALHSIYTDADIKEYLRLLQRKRQGYDGPDPRQWVGVEQFITPYVQE